MARDPVCGMNVREDKNGLRSEYNGQSFYFCSDKCQKEFDRNPASFARDKNPNQNQNPKDDKNKEDKRPR